MKKFKKSALALTLASSLFTGTALAAQDPQDIDSQDQEQAVDSPEQKQDLNSPEQKQVDDSQEQKQAVDSQEQNQDVESQEQEPAEDSQQQKPAANSQKKAVDSQEHVLEFDLKTGTTFVDGNVVELEAPASLVNGRLYVPVRFLSTQLGFETNFNATDRTIEIRTAKAEVLINMDKNTAMINGQAVPFDTIGVIQQDRLLLAARTMSELIELPIDYNAETKIVKIIVKPVKPPLPKQENMKPVAQFSTDKKVYRIGEPIEYIDLSYDPDASGYYPSWSNKQSAFFSAGKKTITLTTKDPQGLQSDPFSRQIEITNEVLTTQDEFPFYFGSMEDDPKRILLDYNKFLNYQVLDKKEEIEDSRSLIVSDSPEPFKEYGILYQSKASGKSRLFATHINDIEDQMATVSVLVTNTSDEPVKIKTTRKGEVMPSKVAELLGKQILDDWFLHEEINKEQVIQPGQTATYYRSYALFPKQGIHFMYDIEVEGEATFTFVAHDPNESGESLLELPKLAKDNNVRGTYPVSTLLWEVDASDIDDKPARISIGDTRLDSWVKGTDEVTGEDVQNKGNYGVFYHVEIKNPGKAAIALVSRGGLFKGSILLNEEKIIPIPKSGVVLPRTAYLLDRTTGKEDSISLRIAPPSGTALPFDILIFPLRDLDYK